MKLNKKIVIIPLMLICTVIIVLGAMFKSFAVECEVLPDEVLRLHILANSNSEQDQDLKYALRDYIINDLGANLHESTSLEEAENKVQASIQVMEEKSGEFVRLQGFDYPVKAEVCEMYFTTRIYGDLTIPAGNYKALRIIIGNGDGENWWCVMFPPLCLPGCIEKNSEIYFNKETSKMIEKSANKAEYRFKIYEWLSALLNKK